MWYKAVHKGFDVEVSFVNQASYSYLYGGRTTPVDCCKLAIRLRSWLRMGKSQSNESTGKGRCLRKLVLLYGKCEMRRKEQA
ncbi:hypothetical protein RIF29_41742 [Crotalaria pallida]|uniref:Uncharacterized protein n=1 Tax=Crotalaria pallida TaxID=3830 RepID=A0AAN9HT11_CROPI